MIFAYTAFTCISKYVYVNDQMHSFNEYAMGKKMAPYCFITHPILRKILAATVNVIIKDEVTERRTD